MGDPEVGAAARSIPTMVLFSRKHYLTKRKGRALLASLKGTWPRVQPGKSRKATGKRGFFVGGRVWLRCRESASKWERGASWSDIWCVHKEKPFDPPLTACEGVASK